MVVLMDWTGGEHTKRRKGGGGSARVAASRHHDAMDMTSTVVGERARAPLYPLRTQFVGNTSPNSPKQADHLPMKASRARRFGDNVNTYSFKVMSLYWKGQRSLLIWRAEFIHWEDPSYCTTLYCMLGCCLSQ